MQFLQKLCNPACMENSLLFFRYYIVRKKGGDINRPLIVTMTSPLWPDVLGYLSKNDVNLSTVL